MGQLKGPVWEWRSPCMWLGLLGGRVWLPWTVPRAHERRRRPQRVPQVPSTSQLPLTSSLSPSSGHTHGPERLLCTPLSGRAPWPRSAWAHRLGARAPNPTCPAPPAEPPPQSTARPGWGFSWSRFPAGPLARCAWSECCPQTRRRFRELSPWTGRLTRLLSPPRSPGFSPCGCTRRHRRLHVDRLPPRQVLA